MGTCGQTHRRVKRESFTKVINHIIECEEFSNIRSAEEVSIKILDKVATEEEAMDLAEKRADPWDKEAIAVPYDHEGSLVYVLALLGKC